MRAGRYEKQPGGFRAFLPANLPPDPPVAWSNTLSTRLEAASHALGRLDGIIQFLPNPERLAAMHVRREAVLSSQIEGVQSSLLDLLAAEARISIPDTPQDVSEVLNYVRALNHGLKALGDQAISVPLLCKLHGILLRETRGAELPPGELRNRQVWIGSRHTPIERALFVPPPAHAVARSMNRLVEYVNAPKDLPTLVWIGLVHVQFETIHPFLDGNGRLGRLLITLLLQREGKLKHPVLYLSHYFKRRRPEYYAHLGDYIPAYQGQCATMDGSRGCDDTRTASWQARLNVATPTATPDSTTENRIERYRIRFDKRAQAAMCAQIAGASRLSWNILLADCERRYQLKRDGDAGIDTSVSYFTLGRRFVDLRRRPDAEWIRDFLDAPHGERYRDTDLSWLRDMPCAPLRYTAKYLAGAYTQFFKACAEAKAEGKSLGRRKSDGKPKGFPKYKRKFDRDDGFTIPDNVCMDGHRLRIPKVGWVRLEGSGLYKGHKAKQVRILKEGTEDRPKWYAYVFHEVSADQLKQPAWTGAIGVDRNVGQSTDSDNKVYEVPDDPKLEGKIKRKERKKAKSLARSKANGKPMSNRGRRISGQLKKAKHKQKRRREDAAHRHSRRMANKAHVVVLEDLVTGNMTKSAKGTVGNPGTNVKAKSGLNREILKSNWGRLERHLAYKAGEVRKVPPEYTSQTCSRCGNVDKANRRAPSLFRCTDARCGHTANADHNAALNILERGLALFPTARGVGVDARREAFGLCPPPVAADKSTSQTREQGVPPLPRGDPSWYAGI